MCELLKVRNPIVRNCLRSICFVNLKIEKPSKNSYKYRIVNNRSISMNENVNDFSNEFLENHINLSSLQKLILIAGSSIASLFDPRRHDMIACLGETTGDAAISNILQTMNSNSEGNRILQQKPRINTQTVNIHDLRKLPNTTLGYAYVKFLDTNKVTPDSRMPVRFIEDDSLAYIMTRYRECHDLLHTILEMPTDMLGEVTVKWVEALNTGLPMCYAGAIFGAIRLLPQQRKRYMNQYLPWAIRNGTNAKPLMNVYWEERWQQDLEELRQELNITTLNL